MPRRTRKMNSFLRNLPDADRIAVEEIRDKSGVRGTHTLPQIHAALLLHRERKIPVTLALEIGKDFVSRSPFENRRAIKFITNLSESTEAKTKYGKVNIAPSFSLRTGRTHKRDPAKRKQYGLDNFAWMSFRISPSAEHAEKFRPHLPVLSSKTPYRYGIIVEVGLAEVGGRPMVVVVNAQALKAYYSLPWNLKKIFKGSYDIALDQISAAAGNVPVLIPSNKTVRGYIQEIFGHDVSESVLNEFYDRFCEKRKYKKATFSIKNALGGGRITGEFWVPPKSKAK
ncbi:MAG: hypothetical protein ABIH20_06070 [Candidatus Diapherotrites archaeon]